MKGRPRRKSLRSVAERNALAEANLGLVGLCVRRFPWHCPATRDDAEQAGRLTLLRAAELWDEAKGVKFCTYAVTSVVRGLIQFRKQQRLIHSPFGGSGAAARERQRRIRARTGCVAFSVLESGGWGALPLEAAPAPPPAWESHDERLIRAVNLLTPGERRAVVDRFVKDLNYAQSGAAAGLSRERARQLVRAALRRLRRLLGVA